MIPDSKTVALLDACVLYPAPVRDLLLSVADEGLFNPVWSQTIQDEWINNLLQNRQDLKRENLIETTRAMNNAFPQANILNYKPMIHKLTLPDENDRHVLAAAISGKAQFIITFNIKDFPFKTLAPHNIKSQHPDVFLSGLFDTNPELVCEAFIKMVKRLKNPPINPDKVLSMFRSLTLIGITKKLEEYCIRSD
jgi:predicted nucleic acid-binding protein